MLRKISKISLVLMMLALTVSAFSASAADAIYEAEDADIDALVVASDRAGFSGKGFVDLGEGPKIEFKVNVAEAGKYSVVIRYLLPNDYGTKNNNIVVNGKDLGEKTFSTTGEEYVDKAVDVDLTAGENTIAISKNWGYIFVDYLKVVGGGSDTAAAEAAPASDNPKTGDAGLLPYLFIAIAATIVLITVRRKNLV